MDENHDNTADWSTLPTNISTTESPITDDALDPVIVIIWTIGVVLLITLIVLMVCILRSHHKGRRDRRNGAHGRGGPRHGGDNHGFSTNYDEIWTWIPIITESQNRCPSQINPSARGNGSQQRLASNQQRDLLNNLRLPSYNEAVRNNSQNNSSTNQNRPNHIQLSNRNHVTNQRSSAPVSNRSETRPQPSVPTTTRARESSNSLEHHYETIPPRRAITSGTTLYSSAPNNVTSVSVTSSSGAPVPRTTSRISIDQSLRSGNPRLPPVPRLQSPGPDRRGGAMADNRIITGNVGASSNPRATRNTSSNIYPIMNDVIPRQAFQHSSASVFTYCGTQGNQRVYSDIPRSVSAVYEAPTLQIRGVHTGVTGRRSDGIVQADTSLSNSARDNLRRLESEYF